ncbi:MAG: hypothetical protein PHF10_00910 [Patescibacteria group bacterium]|nr:hypothetical protein [Patescibacteria group bacterium]
MKAKKLLNFRILTGAVLLVMFLSIMTPVLFYPKQAQAQMVVHDPLKVIVDKVWEFLKLAWKNGAGIAYKNAINTYTSQIATQTAEWVASGGKGQTPMFIADPDYWVKVGDNMLGEFIDAAAGPKGFFGQSLCDPIDPTLRLNILISFDPLYRQKTWTQENKCSFTKIRQRIKEASQKNLIEFSVDLKEGPVGRYQSSFKSIFEADSKLNEWQTADWPGGDHKTNLKMIADKITSIQKDFSQTVEDLKANKNNTSLIQKENIQADFRNRINNNVWGPDEPPATQYGQYLKFWQKNTSACAAKNKENFCQDLNCYNICSKTDCLGNFTNCLAYTNRANLYVKQLIDWTNQLTGMINKTDFTALTTKEEVTLEDIGRMYSEDNDLRITLSLQSSLMEKQANAVSKSQYFQSLQGRLNDVTTKISGLTKTPSSLVDTAAREAVKNGTASPMQYTGVAVADAIGIFTNTLIDKLLKQIFEKGYNVNVSPEAVRTQPFLSGEGGLITLGSNAGGSLFSDLTVASLKKGGEISIYDEYSVCPQDPKYALPSNCVMDSGMVRALEDNLTLKQAMDKNLIHSDWLVSGRSKKDAATDYLGRYSLTNIKKLRAIRVFPLGLEIAAQKIYDGKLGDAQFTLKDIVDGFDKVSSDGDCRIYIDPTKTPKEGSMEIPCPVWDNDHCYTNVGKTKESFSASPFCHLVDPNWVLKAPSFQCETIAYSAIPLPGSNQRQETCIDMKDCIHEDANGKCDTWGYCTREKNIWRAGGNSCDSQFNTCQTYTKTSDKKSSSYLANTLNFANCSVNDVGCKWYCSDYQKSFGANKADIWACEKPGVSLTCIDRDESGQCTTYGKNGTEQNPTQNAIFFNRNVEKCDKNSEGCHEYIRTATDSKIYLKTAPEWMDCEGDSPSLECSNFATSCEKEDVGCGLYAPINNDPTIPGIVSEGNRCSEKCVGTNYFKEMKTNFETNQPDVLLIPSLAKSCSAPGCEEFTNLDEVAKGGEGIQYYSYIRTCQKPDTQTCGYYYTWVGSDTNGYQLKKYYLTAGAGGPAEIDSPSAQFGICDKDQIFTNPHCKEFYDADGKVSYRIYENTITCSDDCHPLRITIPTGFDSTKCSNSGGTWDNGNCIYQTIPTESVSCSKANIGCREYKGNAANNVRQILKSDFEDAKDQGWNGTPVNESGVYTGHSLQSPSFMISHSVSLTSEKSYILSFWARGNGDYYSFFTKDKETVWFNNKDKTTIFSDDWQEIKLGPIYSNNQLSSGDWELNIRGPNGFYVDDIILKEVKDDLNLIKDSWKTKMPAGCTVSGCQAYKDQNNKLQYLTSFARLCDEKSVGCEALIDTKNSTSPFAETFKNGTTVPDDSPIYLINDSKKSCQETNKGCQRFGLPTLSSEDTVVGWSDLYLRNNPDNYSAKILCDSANTGCEEYKINGSGSSVYFKDPGENLCEWREKIMVGGENKTGWFKKGTSQPCYYNTDNTPYQINGLYSIKTSAEPDYKNIAGVCPQKQTGCTQFTDFGATVGNNLINGGDFETGNLGQWTPAYGSVAKPDTIQLLSGFGQPANFLRIESDGSSPRFGVAQYPEFNDLPSGASFNFSAKIKLDNNLTDDVKATVYLDLFYRGNKEFDNQGCIVKIDDKSVPRDCSDSESAIVRTCADQGKDNCTGSNDLEKSYVQCLKDVNLGNVNGWCFNWVYGYQPAVGWGGIDTTNKDWITLNKTIVAGGKDNPKNLPLYKIMVSPVLVKGNGTAGVIDITNSSVYADFDDISLKQIQNYYYLDDDKLDQSSCQGNVSQKQDCILLLDSSLKNADGQVLATYNTFATYKKSEATNPKYGLVSPVDCTKGVPQTGKSCTDAEYTNTDYCKYCSSYGQIKNDANTILKVRQDRTCGEWLTCTSSRSEWDKTSGSFKDICEAVGRCDKLIGTGNANQCGHLIWENDPKVLADNIYQNRDVSWSGMDYAGHSIYNMYPIERLWAKEYNGVYRLSYLDTNGSVYGVDGIKLKSSIQPDSEINSTQLTKSTIGKTCRAYPEKDSPFKSDVEKYYFSDVNVCNDTNNTGENKDCQCSYTKDDYGGTTKYYNTAPTTTGICVSSSDGKETGDTTQNICVSTQNDHTPGIWKTLTKQTNALGLRGFCLEPDPSKPADLNACITWWPGAAIGDPDIYNQFTSAGYQAANERQWYCAKKIEVPVIDLQSEGNLTMTSHNDCKSGETWKCAWQKGNICNDVEWWPHNWRSDSCSTNITGIYSVSELDNCNLDCPAQAIFSLGNSSSNRVKNLKADMVESININVCSCTSANGAGDTNTCSSGSCTDISGNDSGSLWGWDPLVLSLNDSNSWTSSYGSGNGVKIIANWKEDQTFDSLVLKAADEKNFGYFKINSITLKIKNDCEQVVKIADTDRMATAYTNRVNNIKNYFNDSVDGKTEFENCTPWGAVKNWDTSTVYITESSNTCEINKGALYDYTGNIKDSVFAKKLFARSFDVKTFSLSDFQYHTGSLYTVLDSTNTPQVAAPTCDELTNVCKMDSEGASNHITIGNVYKDGENITRVQSYLAILKFYAWANENQMPIREISIDWGDRAGEVNPYSVIAKNHKQACCEGSGSCANLGVACKEGINAGKACNKDSDCLKEYALCTNKKCQAGVNQNQACDKPEDCPIYSECQNMVNLNFGNIPDACTNNYFQFTHIYQCAGEGSPGWNAFKCSNTCCFKPRVYVQDNWGWCNNGKENVLKSSNGKCNGLGIAGTPFGGLIIIRPQ